MVSLSESNGNGNGSDNEKNNIHDSPDSVSDAGDDDHSSNAQSVRPAARPDGNGHDITGLHHHHSDDDDAGTDEEDEAGSEDEVDSDEDEEPALKYERLGGITHQLLQKDSASAITYANQRIVSSHLRHLGT